MNRLNIAILTCNALEYTKMCLSSIRNYTDIDHDIYILDNASTDGSPQWLWSKKAINWHILTSSVNFGVPRGRNVLLNRIISALPDDGFIIFLDNDIEVHSGWHVPFFELFDRCPEIGIAGVMGHEIVVHDAWRELMPSPENDPAPVDIVSGYCFWVRAETVHAVGLFDENLGLFWHEDDDYCIRAINKGFEVFVIPDNRIVHYGHKSGVGNDSSHLDHSLKNQRYLVQKWRQLGIVDSDGRIIR